MSILPPMPEPEQTGEPRLKRREFLGLLSAGAMGAGVAHLGQAAEPAGVKKPGVAEGGAGGAGGSIFASPPVLQHPSSSGVTVVWAVSAAATGWVEYGPTAELGQRADLAVHGLNPYGFPFLSARLEGLAAGKIIHYRVVSVPVTFSGAYKITRGTQEAGEVYTFTPPDPAAERATLTVINDTHEKGDTLKAIAQALAATPSDFTLWNGDVFNDIRSDEQIVQQVLRPGGAAFAASQPVLFTSGNHDVRGVHARALAQAIPPWLSEEPLGRCFTVRHGPLAIVGLDTGEDKPDHHPAWAGLANFEPYRKAQGAWLKRALARPEVAGAPFIVVCCHIPLWGLPGDNPGDTLEGYASYSRNSQQQWHEHLAAAKVHLVISGHTHKHRFDPPNNERPYAQLIGGGPQLERATLIRSIATRDTLEVGVTNLAGTELGRWEFKPRAV